jgi:hypothetical protein
MTATQGTLSASNYTFTLVNGTLTVNQATPTISWATPAAITYGRALSATLLDACSPVARTLVYSPLAGTILSADRIRLRQHSRPLFSQNESAPFLS